MYMDNPKAKITVMGEITGYGKIRKAGFNNS